MNKLHYFNPGHETSVSQGKVSFTPSRNVRKMISDLSLLPIWYAEAGDYVLTEAAPPNLSWLPTEIIPDSHPVSRIKLNEKREHLPSLKATPWGISPSALHQMRQLKEQTGITLDIPQWQKTFIRLTGRQTAASCLRKIKKRLPCITFPEIPLFVQTVEEIQQYLEKNPGSHLLKMPYSSSGRGLLWINGNHLTIKEKEWINGAIKKQESISIEPILKKIKDFGWEFLSDGKGAITYTGISPFDTNGKGSFTGNQIYPQEQILQDVFKLIDPEIYNHILISVTAILRETYSSIYEGCIGVDIMIYQTEQQEYLLHPFVEINMRYTMGYLSLQLEKIILPDSKGLFQITYDKDPGNCFNEHLKMQEEYPLQIINGKIRKGYLSLCPVTPDTNYKAVLLVE